ncbi:MAG: hypothetical protein DRP45_01470 [Candidatus Zixiibacteriota bacterium]|nr:MAG: hypothetical protein DRP45_01470 [candidate division Zixibacteria bacterium]
MTNLKKKSFIASFCVIIALAFCCALIGQSVAVQNAQAGDGPLLRTATNQPPKAVDTPAREDAPKESFILDKTTRTSPVLIEMEKIQYPPFDYPTRAGKITGDLCTDPHVVTLSGSPGVFSVSDNTTLYNANYEGSCASYGLGMPDVVYAFTPGADMTVEATTCNSADGGMDSYLYVYDDCPMTNELACDQDGCDAPVNYGSKFEVDLTGGTTYYFVVDGEYSWAGEYTFDITEIIPVPDPLPCGITIPGGAIADSDPVCDDLMANPDPNGGCFTDPPSPFDAIACGETYKGNLWLSDAEGSGIFRDGDWYTFTLAEDMTVTFTADADLPWMLNIYQGTPCSGVDLGAILGLACDEQVVPIILPAGDYYFLMCGDFYYQWPTYPEMFYCANGPFEYYVGIECVPYTPPVVANDDCADATAISGMGSFAFTTVDATTDGPLCTAMSSYSPEVYNDVWYCWQSDYDGEVTIDVCDGGFDSKMVLYADCACGYADGDELTYDDDGCAKKSSSAQMNYTVTNGTYYMIRIGAYSSSGSGSGNLVIAPAPTGPANNHCANAIAISGEGTTAYTTIAATTDGPQVAYGTQVNNDIWYCFTPTSDGVYEFSLCDPAGWDQRIALYDGCACGYADFSEVAYDDDGCSAPDYGYGSVMEHCCLMGNTYMIRIGGWSSANYGTGNMVITRIDDCPPALANDNCADYISIAGEGSTPYTTVDATTDGPLCSQMAWHPNVYNDVWFCFTPTTTGWYEFDICSGWDTRLVLYEGCACGYADGDEVAYDDDGCGTYDYDSRMYACCDAGVSYMIRIGAYSSSGEGSGDLVITNTGPCPAPPLNDNCFDVIPGGIGEDYFFDVTGTGTFTCSFTTALATTDCPYLPYPDMWIAMNVLDCQDVVIEFCGSNPGSINTIFLGLLEGCPCTGYYSPNGSFCTYGWDCVDGNPIMTAENLPVGMHWILVVDDGGVPANIVCTVHHYASDCGYCCVGSNSSCGAYDEWIDNVTVGSIDNTSGCTPLGYADYTAMSTFMWQLFSYPMAVTCDNTWTSDVIGAWVDWNQDMSLYGLDEEVLYEEGAGPVYSTVITPPATALGGETTMRIRLFYIDPPQWVDPCGYELYGETEDYTIEVGVWECGDCDGDLDVDIDDVICLIDFYFNSGAAPTPEVAGDVNNDGFINIGDIIYLADYVNRADDPPVCM